MALKKNFYNEIFDNEQNWIDLINSNLINGIYCKFNLKPFYEEKRKELEEVSNLAPNIMISQIIFVINRIINHLDLLIDEYYKSELVDVKSLLPLFLINQMNNSNQNESKDINELLEKRRILRGEISNINRDNNECEDYVYDDFPEELKKIK